MINSFVMTDLHMCVLCKSGTSPLVVTDLHMFVLCKIRTTNKNPAVVSCQLCLEYVQEVSRLYITIIERPLLAFHSTREVSQLLLFLFNSPASI